MADKEPQGFKEEQALWNAYLESWQSRGINIDEHFAKWAEQEAQKLNSPGAQEDFAELCKDACNPQVLAANITLIRYCPRFESIWAMMVGPPENRQKVAGILEDAAATLENVFRGFMAVEDENDRAKFAKIGRIPPSRMVSELRLYGRLINMAKLLAVDTEAHSLEEVSRYILSSYVNRATGRPHDKNVSGLIAEITNSPHYNEVAYRMWRNRNYERLEKYFSWIIDLLVAMVTARPT
jgi:hypothetical protein